jgi:hypothetical protein
MKTLNKTAMAILLFGTPLFASPKAEAACNTWDGIWQTGNGTSGQYSITCNTTYFGFPFSHTLVLTAQQYAADGGTVHIVSYSPTNNGYGYYDGTGVVCVDGGGHTNNFWVQWGQGGQNAGPTFKTVDSCSNAPQLCRFVHCPTGTDAQKVLGGGWLADCSWYGTC